MALAVLVFLGCRPHENEIERLRSDRALAMTEVDRWRTDSAKGLPVSDSLERAKQRLELLNNRFMDGR